MKKTIFLILNKKILILLAASLLTIFLLAFLLTISIKTANSFCVSNAKCTIVIDAGHGEIDVKLEHTVF